MKVLVADVLGQRVEPVWEDSKQTRLGRGFYETHQLQPEPLAKTARAVAKFALLARAQNASSIRVIGTSAARDAINAGELIDAVEHASGLKMEVISGDLEAEWAFAGVATDPQFARELLLILDVGGGSTEFILGQDQHMHFRESFPIGTVRLLETIPHSDPPQASELAACREWIARFVGDQIRPKLAPAIQSQITMRTSANPVQLVGTGGTTSILARMEAELDYYDRARMEATRLSLPRLRWHLDRLWNLTLAERQKIVGLPPKRADVILTGVLIFESIMEQFGFTELRVSTRGLRFAAVMDQ